MPNQKLTVGLCALLSLTAACTMAPSQSAPVAGTPQAAQSFDRSGWPKQCQALKQTLSQQPELNLVYQPRPATVKVPSSWAINWVGQRVPIPAIAYGEVIVFQSSDHSSHAFLKGTLKGQPVKVVLGSAVQIAPMEDVSAMADWNSGQAVVSEQGKAMTKQLFGGPVKNSDLIDLGYRHTPADLRCGAQNWQTDLPMAMALSLKGIAQPNSPTAVYELARGQVGHSPKEQQDVWTAQWNPEGLTAEATLQLPKGHDYGPIWLAIGQSDWQAAPNPPQWLGALETAVAKPERPNWLALAAALKQAGMSEKSVKAAQVLADGPAK
jgi:hypothetical protein